MTPPPAATAKKVEDPKPVAPPAEAKVEAKADVKADAPVPVINFGDTSAYTLKVDVGYGGQNFGNGQGVDHYGPSFGIGGPWSSFGCLAPMLFVVRSSVV